MGEVYLVRHPRLSRHNAVKVLPADFPHPVPVLLSVVGWGDKYKNDVPPMRLIHGGCGHAAEPHMTCAHCGEPVSWREMTAELQPDAW